MHNRNIVKVRIIDTGYYFGNAKYFFNQGDRGRCIVYLASVRSYIIDTIKSFKKF